MIERVLFSATFAFSPAFAAESPAEPPAAWVQAYTAANQKHRAGDYAGAEAALAPVIATVLQSDSNDHFSARMLAEYASIHQDLGQPRSAETFYRRSLAVSAHLSPLIPSA